MVGENVEPGIYNLREALAIAENRGLDLVEISPTANPPVCRVIDYKKFLYELKRKQKEMKAKTARIIVKEIRLGPNTDDHDFNFKLNHCIKFLKDGAKVKVDVFFKGRSIIYKEQGEMILLKFAQSIVDYGKIEQMPATGREKNDHDHRTKEIKLLFSCIFLLPGKEVKLNNSKLRQMPKMKSKSGAKKRFDITGTGKIKRKHAYKSHILTKKSTKRKRNLTYSALVSKADEANVKEMLQR